MTASSSAAMTMKRSREEDIFKALWLNRSVAEARQEHRLRRIERSVSEFLIDQLRPALDSPSRQQALFSLLGQGFVQRHFPHHKFKPAELERLAEPERLGVVADVKRFVDEKVRLGLDEYRRGHAEDAKLTGHIREIVFSDFHAEIHRRLSKERKIKIKHGKRGRTKVIELQDTSRDRAGFVEATLNELRGSGNDVDLMIMEQLYSRVLILPTTFRQHVFRMIYLDGLGAEETEEQRAEYEAHVRNQLRKRGLSNISDWSGREAVDASVILAYERSKALKAEFEDDDEDNDDDENEHDKEDATDRLVFYSRILTINKLCDGEFSPTHIFWLVRADKYFPHANAQDKSGRALSAAFHFKKFFNAAIYDLDKVFRLAQSVYDVLEEEEPQLVEATRTSLGESTRGSVDPTLFSPDIIVEDEASRADLWRRFLKTRRVESEEDLRHFADPRLFIRKWLSEAFVGSLARNGAALVWDFLLLHKFGELALTHVCLALWHLLKPLLGGAATFSQAQHVLIEGPRVLYTRDLRRVLTHLAKNGAYNSIPGAPDVPKLEITPPSANPVDRKAMERRIESLSLDFGQ